MIIQINTPDAAGLNEARRAIQELVGNWSHEITDTPAGTSDAETDGKAIDPVAIASLTVSLPSAVLAVTDLADRIRKRRRAAELIDHARQQAGRQITITVITPGSVTKLATLLPDQLLDLQTGQDPAR